MKFGSLLFILLPTLLTGCTSILPKSTKLDASHSYAWNINNASNMDLFFDKEVPTELKNKFEDSDYYWGLTTDNNPLNLSRMDMTPLIKYSYPVGMALKEWDFDYMLAWLPQNLATSEKPASIVIEQVLNEAIKKTWPDMQFNRMSEMNGSPLNTFTLGLAGNKSRISTYFIWDNDIHCQTNRFDNQNKPNACLLYIKNEGAAGLVKTPEFIRSGTTEHSYMMDPSYISIDITDNRKLDAIEARNNRALIQKLSSNLPSWIYIYLSDDIDNNLPAVMLQSGKSHFYIN